LFTLDPQTQDAASLDQILKFDYIDFHCHKFTNPEPLGAASLAQVHKSKGSGSICTKVSSTCLKVKINMVKLVNLSQ
jgi:hypothetical protein